MTIANIKYYNNLSNNFNLYHNNNINIFIHLITTPLSLLELISIINKLSNNALLIKSLSLIYCISLAYNNIPFNVLYLTSYAISIIVVISSKIKIKLLYNILLFIVGYLAQDLSHYLTNEATYQSSYISQKSQDFVKNLTEHTYYLLPLIITSSIKYEIIYYNTNLYKLLGILPMIFVYTSDYLILKGYIVYPWDFQEYKIIKKEYSNIYYITSLLIISYFTDYKIFLIGTSYIHYIQYIYVYYYRSSINYNKFKRDVIFYKFLSLAQLYSLYTSTFTSFSCVYNNILSIIIIISSNILSGYSAYLLGTDGCYFGIELGYVNKNKNYVSKFPYGYIPHPMILSQCISLYFMNNNFIFYNNWPFLIYFHILFYIIHMIQEHFDLHKINKLPI
jgi:hypothetical protein